MLGIKKIILGRIQNTATRFPRGIKGCTRLNLDEMNYYEGAIGSIITGRTHHTYRKWHDHVDRITHARLPKLALQYSSSEKDTDRHRTSGESTCEDLRPKP